MLIVYQVAGNIADQPYDEALSEDVQLLTRLVHVQEDKLFAALPAPARLLFRADTRGTFYYQVAYREGGVIAGDSALPAPPEPMVLSQVVVFRDEMIGGENLRIAALKTRAENGAEIVAQMAESHHKRAVLSTRIVTGVLLPQIVTIPLVVLLVWLGLKRGIAPLQKLREMIEKRRPTDLSPITHTQIPEEIRPLVNAFNGVMAQLDENLLAQRRFINDAAHQMRTPLTGLKMQTELALMETDPAAQRAALERIASSADRASHLINQLLVLARAESGSERIYTVKMVDLPHLVAEEVQTQYPLAHAKKVDLAVEEPEWGMRVEGNPVLLRELIKNLLNNAVKYTPPGGEVVLRTLWMAQPVLEVEDTGVGIPESEREKVFERFYRVLGSHEEGSGLGLAIVREIVQIHGARIFLLPRPEGSGTLVRVIFPRGIQMFSDAEPHPSGFFPLG